MRCTCFPFGTEQAYIHIEKIIRISMQSASNVIHQGITISQPHMGTCVWSECSFLYTQHKNFWKMHLRKLFFCIWKCFPFFFLKMHLTKWGETIFGECILQCLSKITLWPSMDGLITLDMVKYDVKILLCEGNLRKCKRRRLINYIDLYVRQRSIFSHRGDQWDWSNHLWSMHSIKNEPCSAETNLTRDLPFLSFRGDSWTIGPVGVKNRETFVSFIGCFLQLFRVILTLSIRNHWMDDAIPW